MQAGKYKCRSAGRFILKVGSLEAIGLTDSLLPNLLANGAEGGI